MGNRAVFYLRVSTTGQTVENQHRELSAVAVRAGWDVVEVYTDSGISGAKGREDRPEFDRLLKAAARREFDLVAAWSVDRLGRSLLDLLGFLKDLHDSGIGLYLHQQGLDTTTHSGRAMFQMMGVFAEFERAMIRERVAAGQARARAQGKHMGRPRLSGSKEAAIRAALGAGAGIHKAAKLCGVGVSAVQRIRAAMAQPSSAAETADDVGGPAAATG